VFILLPLASNIKVKKYKYGEYIVRAGENPEGLMIISQGHAIVCAEKLAMRSNEQTVYSRIKNKPANVKTNPCSSSQMVLDLEKNKAVQR